SRSTSPWDIPRRRDWASRGCTHDAPSRLPPHLVVEPVSGLTVVKVGGSEGVDLDAVCDDVAKLTANGARLVLLHGGSSETNRVSTLLGRPPRFVTSPSGHQSRFTDRATLEVFEMVYCGKVNKGIVERLQARAVNAVGLSGLDGRLL